MKIRALSMTAVAALLLSGVALAATAKGQTLTIRHQTVGCHSWSLDGKHWSAHQSISLTLGARLTVVDNDVMPHTLAQISGPKAQLATPAMRHIGAQAHAVFPTRGVYVLGTKPGEDYVKGVKTVGPDNALRLTVTVR